MFPFYKLLMQLENNRFYPFLKAPYYLILKIKRELGQDLNTNGKSKDKSPQQHLYKCFVEPLEGQHYLTIAFSSLSPSVHSLWEKIRNYVLYNEMRPSRIQKNPCTWNKSIVSVLHNAGN